MVESLKQVGLCNLFAFQFVIGLWRYTLPTLITSIVCTTLLPIVVTYAVIGIGIALMIFGWLVAFVDDGEHAVNAFVASTFIALSYIIFAGVGIGHVIS